MLNLIRKINFKNSPNHFQSKIFKDIRNIKNSNKLQIKADKSKNIYQFKPADYHQIITNKMTCSYKKDKNQNIFSSLNDDMTKCACKCNFVDRIGTTYTINAHFLFKDHKSNFTNNIQSRLINSSKSELGLISKEILKK